MSLVRGASKVAQRAHFAQSSATKVAPATAFGRRGIASDAEREAYVSPLNGAPRIYSPWNKWFPYEPVPCSPKIGPYVVNVEGQQTYWWCSCGESRTQPWCEGEGGPSGCQCRGFAPLPYVPRYSGRKLLCGCKHAGQKPLCNGTCCLVWSDVNTVPAIGLGFLGSFVTGLFLTWMMHP
mmetsp:Transcript_94606/g.267088  ORF Transcript_94606/g.267088 Transcript_94606/m.267088 type:complete len:179 (-) Transcript_94606:79-615(-)